ncbi:hypothetical protein CAEBREN_00937 [Caenorhabditis brenneri]|uniref:Uncharacterized protein n=1 Tax=Caenorhabditis brenneri TaxID=135651 RepID=G0NBT1_CAEBE|nr:hypothetical protein CAEBREN_00937 [Caenorhabditis brenneri]
MLEYPITHPTTSIHYSQILATSSSNSEEDHLNHHHHLQHQHHQKTGKYRLIQNDEEDEETFREGAESATSNTVLLMADTITPKLLKLSLDPSRSVISDPSEISP